MLMRAFEFINESKEVHTKIKPNKEIEFSLPSAHRVAGTADRVYDLNRIMQYVAASDGKVFPKLPKESWSGRNNTAHPYTKEEAEMLKHAYMMAGTPWEDALNPNPNNESLELPDINKKSPVVSFKGYH